MREVVYLYGFVPAAATAPPAALTGIADAQVEVMPLDLIGAVTSRLHADEFSSEQIEQQLQNLAWVAERGVEHERVVAWFVDHAQIIPASLFTLYSSEAALRENAIARTPVIAAELQRLGGMREWDLKVSYDAVGLAENAARFSDDVRQLDTEISAASPGKRYLLERKRTDLAKAEILRIATKEADRVKADAAKHAAQVVTLPIPQSREQLPVVLHAALLVARDQEAKLISTLESKQTEYQQSGMRIAFSGPWAPYRFVKHG